MSKKIIRGSGNVFADLGFEHPEEYSVKADLALEIGRIIKRRKLTQKQAAKIIGATQPDISKLMGGQLKGFTLERLISFLRCFERDIKIVVKKAPQSRKKVVRSKSAKQIFTGKLSAEIQAARAGA